MDIKGFGRIKRNKIMKIVVSKKNLSREIGKDKIVKEIRRRRRVRGIRMIVR